MEPTLLATPITLELIDGKPSSAGSITQKIILPTSFNGFATKCETTFLVTSLGQSPLVLGYPWLSTHNPLINWTDRTLAFQQTGTSALSPVSTPCTSSQSSPETAPLAFTPSLLSQSSAEPGPMVPQPSGIEFQSESLPPSLQASPDKVVAAASVQSTSSGLPSTTSSLPEQLPSSDNGDKHVTDLIPLEYHHLQDVFNKQDSEVLPPHPPFDHSIPLEEGRMPPFGPIYSLSEKELATLKDYIDSNLQSGFIAPSSSPSGAPILFVKKKDGSLRLCVDYRGLNKITIKNRYPLPLIGELLDRLGQAKFFTKIDLRNAYNQIRIAEGDEWKTAFRTRYGLFEYRVMPFGLTNAPASFQHLVNFTFRDMLDKFIIVYLDDILIYSSTLEEHHQHVEQVLQRLQEHKLYAKAEKCEFHSRSVEFLGFKVSPDGISMDPGKVQAISEWPSPKNVTEVQSFLGFTNFYRQFIRSYSAIAAPLTNLTKKDKPFCWAELQETAFTNLKHQFATASLLKHFNPALPLVLETDASDFAICSVLSQYHQDRLHPIAFYSRKMSSSELNYEIHDKEMLAIVASFKH